MKNFRLIFRSLEIRALFAPFAWLVFSLIPRRMKVLVLTRCRYCQGCAETCCNLAIATTMANHCPGPSVAALGALTSERVDMEHSSGSLTCLSPCLVGFKSLLHSEDHLSAQINSGSTTSSHKKGFCSFASRPQAHERSRSFVFLFANMPACYRGVSGLWPEIGKRKLPMRLLASPRNWKK